MRRPGRLAAAVVASVIVAGACSPAAPPTPAPTPVPTATAAGTYTTKAFVPPLTFTLPDGWILAGDTTDYFTVRPATSDVVGIHVFRSPRAASQEPDCPVSPAAGVGTAAGDLVAWIRARPGLVVSDPLPVTLGGLVGQQVDIGIIEGWAASCPFANGLPTVPLFVGSASRSFRWVVAGAERLRLAILDVPGSGTVVVDIDDFEGSQIDTFIGQADPVVKSMKFGLP